jgi:hypothetical protein
MMPLLHRDGDGGRWVVDRLELWDQRTSLVSLKPGGLPLTPGITGANRPLTIKVRFIPLLGGLRQKSPSFGVPRSASFRNPLDRARQPTLPRDLSLHSKGRRNYLFI